MQMKDAFQWHIPLLFELYTSQCQLMMYIAQDINLLMSRFLTHTYTYMRTQIDTYTHTLHADMRTHKNIYAYLRPL